MNDPTPQVPTPEEGGSSQPPVADEVRLNDLLDDRLPAAEAGALRARLEVEPALQELWGELQRVRDWTRDYGEATVDLLPPSDFAEQIRRRTTAAPRALEVDATPGQGEGLPGAERSDSLSSGDVRGRPRLLRILAVSYAAAALLVVGVTVHWVFQRGSDFSPDATTESATSGRPSTTTTTANAPVAEERAALELLDGAKRDGAKRDGGDRLGSLTRDEDRTKLKAGRESRAARSGDAAPQGDAHAEEPAQDKDAKDRAGPQDPAAGGKTRTYRAGETEEGKAREPASGGRYGAPGGGIAPGLREASDGKKKRAAPSEAPVPEPVVPGRVAPEGAKRGGETRSTGGSSPEAETAGLRRAPAPSRTPAKPTSPTRLRQQLAAAERAGERVFVIEAEDPRAGLREAQRLLDSLRSFGEADADAEESDDVSVRKSKRLKKEIPAPRSDAGGEADPGGKDDPRGEADGGAKRAGGTPLPGGPVIAGQRALRFYALDRGALVSGSYQGRIAGRTLVDGRGATDAFVALEFVGSVGRQVSAAALLHLQTLAEKSGYDGVAASSGLGLGGGAGGQWKRSRPAEPAPPPASTPATPAPQTPAPAPQPAAGPRTRAPGPPPGLAGTAEKAPDSGQAAVRILVLRRK